MGQQLNRFVAEITLVVDAIGTTQLFVFATSGFATAPSDTPASTVVSARLANPGNVRRELFSGARVAGGVRPSFGELVLHNTDGALDIWATYGTSGGKVVVRYGPEGGAYPGAYTVAYVAYIHALRADFADVRLVLRDRAYLFERPFATASLK